MKVGRLNRFSIPQLISGKWSYCKRLLAWLVNHLKTPRNLLVHFQCNICGSYTSFPRKNLRREMWSCRHCGSSVRFRSVVHALSMELFGKSLPLAEFPHRPDLMGIGLSDWPGYADRLAVKLSYTNTFFHQQPFLDITSLAPDSAAHYDFLIASEVFEHVCQPVSKAFANAYRLLKPSGVMILTVPYVAGITQEHFPDICKFFVRKEAGEWVVIGEAQDGCLKKFSKPVFHGGPGIAVECRIFGKDSLLQNCRSASFDVIRIHSEHAEQFGIYWDPSHAEETPPWALLKRTGDSGNAEV